MSPEEAKKLLYSSFPRGIGGGRYLEARMNGEGVKLTTYTPRELPSIDRAEERKRVEKTMSLVIKQLEESSYRRN